MARLWAWGLLSLLLVVSVAFALPVLAQEAEMDPSALHPQSRTSPDISFITSSTPLCYQVDPALNRCLVRWETLAVQSTAPAYMQTMTVTINSRVRAVYQGFFTRSIYVTSAMLGQGLVVPCGALGAVGDPVYGLSHSFAIHAVDTEGLKSANYGTFRCPGVRLVYLPMMLRS